MGALRKAPGRLLPSSKLQHHSALRCNQVSALPGGPAVIAQLEQSMKALCARRGLSCRLHVKNEAAAVQSDEEVVEVRRAAGDGLCRWRCPAVRVSLTSRSLKQVPAVL